MYYTGMVFYGTNMFIIIVIAFKSDGGSFNERPNNNCALAYCAESATHHNYRSIDRWIDGAGCELYVNGGHQVTRAG